MSISFFFFFLKPITTSSNVFSWQQPKDTEFTVIEEERNQEILTVKKLKSDNLYLFPPWKITQNDISITKNSCQLM